MSYVIISQLFRRQPWTSSSAFNSRIVSVHNLLKEGSAALPGVLFLHHRGFWNSMNFLCPDGVHLQCPGGVLVSSPMHNFLAEPSISSVTHWC